MSLRGRILALAAILTASGLLVSECSPTQTASSSPSARVSIAPTPPCNLFTAETTRLIVVGFLDAYNAGAPDLTDRFIAPTDQFQWYGAPGRQVPDDPAASDRRTLPAYFAAQHAKGDRLELKTFSYNGISYNASIPGGDANFSYTLVHSVGGGTPHDAPGKGVVACTSGKIAVWRISSW